ncbi:MAG: YlxR family protein [Anaerolineaceae bacterium]|nr:MAG: YlxR family protein [Anaerolineaceae bacterium]
MKMRDQAKKRRTPERMCAVCRTKHSKRALTRLVNTPDGIMLDPSGKLNGRGAYLCEDRVCWERAVNTSVLEKALRVTLDDDARARIKQAQPAS